MNKGVVGKALVVAAMLAVAMSRGAWANPDEGDQPVQGGGIMSPSLGTLISTVGGNELFADADLTVLMPAGDPNMRTGSSHFTTHDSNRNEHGSCLSGPQGQQTGNIWATSKYETVTFTVKNPDDEGPGTFTIIEQFKNGVFTSTGNPPSPGSCNDGQAFPGKGGVLGPNVQGKGHGHADFFAQCSPLTPNCFQPMGKNCQTDPGTCTNINTFCAAYFTAGTNCSSQNLTAYSFTYRSNDPSLAQHKWLDSFKNGTFDREGDICQTHCGAGNGEDDHGDGHVHGRGGQDAHFSSEEDGPKYGHQSGGEQYSDPGTGEQFQSTQVDAVDFNDLTRVVTITGSGVNQNGATVAFTIVQVPATLAAPAVYTITLSDGYTNTGNLVDGGLSLF